MSLEKLFASLDSESKYGSDNPATVAYIQEQASLLQIRPDFKPGDAIVLDRVIPNIRWEIGAVAVVVTTDPAKISPVEKGSMFSPGEFDPIIIALPMKTHNGGFLFSHANPCYFRIATEEEIASANQNPKSAF